MNTSRIRPAHRQDGINFARGYMNGFLVLIAVFNFLVMTASAVHAQIPPDARRIARTVLAAYDGRDEGAPDQTRIHQLAEMPLNHLGYRLSYWDVNEPPPDVAAEDLAAVLTWFEEPIHGSVGVLQRILNLATGDTRLVMIGDSGAEDHWASAEIASRLLARIGLRPTGSATEVTFESQIAYQDALIGTERPLTPPFAPFPHVVRSAPDVNVHLLMRDAEDESVVVATGPRGGYIASGYAIFYDPVPDRTRWLLDPIAFFRSALGSPRRPVPDTTTLSGRRIYISHIDGDGWNSLTEVDAYQSETTTAADVVFVELIEPYPDLPVSVGMIAGDVFSRLGGRPEGGATARKIYRLPHVEIASHTYTHPFNWQFFENYSRERELELLESQKVGAEAISDRIVRFISSSNDAGADDEARKYVAYSDAFPRAYMRDPFDLEQEIREALGTSTAHGPGKPAELYLWSGETNPFEAAIAATRAAGVRNMNGGDSRYDWEWPSLAYLAPLSRTVGTQRQIYAVSSNENTYTNDWQGPHYGYATLRQTMENTEAPRRLKPIDIYYHMYSGEKAASLGAIKNLLDTVRAQEIAPIAASHYAAIADDFFGIEILAGRDGSWYATNRGAVQTLRIDGAARMRVDIAESAGVIGYTSANEDLYIALDSHVPTAHIVMAKPDQTTDRRLYLKDSRWTLSNFSADTCGFSAIVEGFGPGEFVFEDLAPGPYTIDLAGVRQTSVVVDEDGQARFMLKDPALEPSLMKVSCSEAPRR